MKYEYMSSVLLPYYTIQNQKLIRNLLHHQGFENQKVAWLADL